MRYSLGFTLFEIMLVIAVAGSITAASVVGLSALQKSFRLRSAADEVRAQLELGREKAIANDSGSSYEVSNTTGVVILSSNGAEVSRFIPPNNVSFTPASFTWSFAPITGDLTGCSSPCSLTVSMGSSSVVINVMDNGIIN